MKRTRFNFALAILFFAAATTLVAQSTQSSILGSVTDASGSPVPNATVTVVNEGTGFSQTQTTQESGDYRFSGLETGFYQITVTMSGFKTHAQKRIDLASAQIKRIDAALEVGDVSATVTVEGTRRRWKRKPRRSPISKQLAISLSSR
jgi:uncharacterized protein YfaS (alpha-2-macroglobulin family)